MEGEREGGRERLTVPNDSCYAADEGKKHQNKKEKDHLGWI